MKKIIALLFVTVLPLAYSTSFGEITAIRAGAIVDPDTATVQTNQTILIDGGKIKAIGKDLSIPTDAKLIDLSTQTVLPGLMDAHTHLLAAIDPKWDLGDTWIMTLQRRPVFAQSWGLVTLRKCYTQASQRFEM